MTSVLELSESGAEDGSGMKEGRVGGVSEWEARVAVERTGVTGEKGGLGGGGGGVEDGSASASAGFGRWGLSVDTVRAGMMQ
jgi:hypothetical protein